MLQEQRAAEAAAAAKAPTRNRKRNARQGEIEPDEEEEAAFAGEVDEENERVALWNRHTRQILLLSGAARETTYVPGIKAIWVCLSRLTSLPVKLGYLLKVLTYWTCRALI